MLEVLRKSGMSTGRGIDVIPLTIAAILLPAAVSCCSSEDLDMKKRWTAAEGRRASASFP
jgi:hypothetical protein